MYSECKLRIFIGLQIDRASEFGVQMSLQIGHLTFDDLGLCLNLGQQLLDVLLLLVQLLLCSVLTHEDEDLAHLISIESQLNTNLREFFFCSEIFFPQVISNTEKSESIIVLSNGGKPPIPPGQCYSGCRLMGQPRDRPFLVLISGWSYYLAGLFSQKIQMF